jgi:adenosylcobinamide-GDP ribazoletransferase
MRTLRIAFGLMTTLPIRLPDDWSAGDSGRAAVWYPFVGLVIGALAWLAWAGSMQILPPWVAAIFTLIVWVALTGGLHLDGLADCCDGLLASTSVERRLEIMKDPHIGAFGVTGLILKAAALASLTSASSFSILLAASLARFCILPAGMQRQARSSGMGADFAAGLQPASLVWGAVIPIVIAIFLGLRGIIALLAGLVVSLLIVWFARSRIGGVTGDVFGMIVEIVEVVVLLTFLMGTA